MGPVWVRRAAALALLASAGCGCSAEVVADVTVQLADGGTSTTAGAPYCAQQCVTTADCPKARHCSLHPVDAQGLCFKDDVDAGGVAVDAL